MTTPPRSGAERSRVHGIRGMTSAPSADAGCRLLRTMARAPGDGGADNLLSTEAACTRMGPAAGQAQAVRGSSVRIGGAGGQDAGTLIVVRGQAGLQHPRAAGVSSATDAHQRPDPGLDRPHNAERRTEVKHLRRTRDLMEARLRALLEHVPFGVMFVDGRGEVVDCNDRAAAMLRMRAEALLASNLSCLRKHGLDNPRSHEVASEHLGRSPAIGHSRVVLARASRIPVGSHECAETMYILRQEDVGAPADAVRVNVWCAHGDNPEAAVRSWPRAPDCGHEGRRR
jgi:PAS domain S-box-containing protein